MLLYSRKNFIVTHKSFHFFRIDVAGAKSIFKGIILYVVALISWHTIYCVWSVMQCVFCSGETRVVDKRSSQDATRRRRECIKCKKRFTTYERAYLNLTVIKKDGRHEPFSREKILSGIVKACEKRPVSMEQIEETVNKTENELRKYGNGVYSKKIGELVMKYLKRLDKVAYIRFASVYRSFDDIKLFEEEVKLLKKVV